MIITSSFVDDGASHSVEYHDSDTFTDLPAELCTQAYGLCFFEGQLLIGFGGNKHAWGLVGGTIEPGESFRQTLDRELEEEANMEVLDATPIGYQKIVLPGGRLIYQLRYWCSVRPFGPFVSDPAGGITQIKLIDPTTVKDYFDWGPIGDRLVQRALEIERGHS